MNTNWLDAAQHLAQQGEAYVIVTLVGVTGSTPRDSGTKMVISAEQAFDTIGGGHLEYQVIKVAHDLLAKNTESQQLEHFQLGANLGQCCGGTASVLFECFASNRINVTLFGAGHVGKALISILSGLPIKVNWVDSREEQFPAIFHNDNKRQGNTKIIVSDDPVGVVSQMPAKSYYIVMTHNHQLDFELCQKVLARKDFAYLGLIASDTKWRRFQQRFQHREIPESLISQMSCPIGLPQVTGKKPMEVAVSIAAEIIERYQSQTPDTKPAKTKGSLKGIKWRELKELLKEPESVDKSC